MKRFLIILVILVPTFYCLAQEPMFDAEIIPSIADQQLDFWFYTPPNSGPQVPWVKKVYPEQTFMLLIFCRALPVESQKTLNISYDFKMFASDGQIVGQQTNIPYYNGPIVNRLILVKDHVMDMAFEKGDPFGSYTIEIVLHESISKRQFKTSVKIELLQFAKPESFTSDDAFSEWLMGYYLNPDPIRIFPAIFDYLDTDEQKIKERYHFLSFIRRVLKDNPFLWEYYADVYLGASELEKKKMLVAAAIASTVPEKTAFLSNVDGPMKAYYEKVESITIPGTEDDITHAVQLDILWSEFFASGTYQPIKKIVSALALKEYDEICEKAKNGEILKITPDIEKQITLGIVFQAAEWSLVSNCLQSKRVHQYCQTLYEYDKTVSPIVKEALGIILTVVDKRMKEKTALQK